MNPALFLSPEARETIRSTGLHKMAAALETVKTGREMPDEISFGSAVQLLGERIYEKRASFQKIAKAIAAYEMLKQADAGKGYAAGGNAATSIPSAESGSNYKSMANSMKNAFGGGKGGMDLSMPSFGESLGKTITNGMNKLLKR